MENSDMQFDPTQDQGDGQDLIIPEDWLSEQPFDPPDWTEASIYQPGTMLPSAEYSFNSAEDNLGCSSAKNEFQNGVTYDSYMPSDITYPESGESIEDMFQFGEINSGNDSNKNGLYDASLEPKFATNNIKGISGNPINPEVRTSRNPPDGSRELVFARDEQHLQFDDPAPIIMGTNHEAASQGPLDQDINVNNGVLSYQCLFTDEATFRAAQKAKRASLPLEPTDYPVDASSQQIWVKRLFEAIKNVNGVADSAKVAKSWHESMYRDEVIETLCWELMLSAKDAQEGGKLVPDHYDTKFETFDSFSHRMESIIAVCRDSKAICKSLFAPSFMQRLADQPAIEHRRKGCNQRLNDKKTRQNKAGQLVIKAGIVDQDTGLLKTESEPLDEEENALLHTAITAMVNPAPASRKRNRAMTTAQRLPAICDMAPPPQKRARTMVADQDIGTKRPNSRATRTTRKRVAEGSNRSSELQPNHASPAGFLPNPGVMGAPSFISEPPSAHLEQQYKNTLSALLGVSMETGSKYTIEDMRCYAMAYNPGFKNYSWIHSRMEIGYFGIGVLVYGPSGPDNVVSKGHLALFPQLAHLLGIAIERGDLTDFGGVPNPVVYRPVYTGNDLINDACCGVIDNPYGRINVDEITSTRQF